MYCTECGQPYNIPTSPVIVANSINKHASNIYSKLYGLQCINLDNYNY